MGFGGNSNVASPKWLGRFDHNRFDYDWEDKVYIEEDWVTTGDLTKDFDVIAHSYEDSADAKYADAYDTVQSGLRHYITVGKIGADSVQKWEVSSDTPVLVAESKTNYHGVQAITQAWKHWEDDIIATDLDSTFGVGWNAGGGGHTTAWTIHSSTGALSHHDNDKMRMTPDGTSGIGIVYIELTTVAGNQYTISDFSWAKAHAEGSISYRVGTSANGEEIEADKVIASNTDSSLSGVYKRGTDKFVATGTSTYITFTCTNSAGNESSAIDFDEIEVVGVANKVANNHDIDGFWLFHGEFTGSIYPKGRLVRLDKYLKEEYSRTITGWGTRYTGYKEPKHDGDYISQILQDGEKVWFSAKTLGELGGGFVAANNKEIRIHDCFTYSASGADQYLTNKQGVEQWLHGQINLLFNVDTPDPYDTLTTIHPHDRTPDSSISCNNNAREASNLWVWASTWPPSLRIPTIEHAYFVGPSYSGSQYNMSYEKGEYLGSATDRKSRETEAGYYYGGSFSGGGGIYTGKKIEFVTGEVSQTVTNACWLVNSIQSIGEGATDSTKNIAYKTYDQSMARIPNSKTGVSWFFSAGSAPGGVNGEGQNFAAADVKVAGYVVGPRFTGDGNASRAAGNWNDMVSLHYIFQVGPTYENIHYKIAKGSSPTDDQDTWDANNYYKAQNDPEIMEFDTYGGHLADESGTPLNPNLCEILGGTIPDNVSATAKPLSKCKTGQIWPATFHYNPSSASGSATKDHPHPGGSSTYTDNRKSFATIAEEIRTTGIQHRCIAAPVNLCYMEMLAIRGQVGNSSYYEEEKDVQTYDSLRWWTSDVTTENTGDTFYQDSLYRTAVNNKGWLEIRQKVPYKDNITTDYSGTRYKTYPNDHYDDIRGLHQDVYLHQGTFMRPDIASQADQSGHIDTDVTGSTYPSRAISAQWWAGGVQTMICLQKDGIGQWRSLTDLPYNSGGSPFHLSDSNCDGIAGGSASYGVSTGVYAEVDDLCSCAAEPEEGENFIKYSMDHVLSNGAFFSAGYHSMHYSSVGRQFGHDMADTSEVVGSPENMPFGGYRKDWDSGTSTFRIGKRERGAIEFDMTGVDGDSDTMGMTWGSTDNDKLNELLQEPVSDSQADHDTRGWQYAHTANSCASFTSNDMNIDTGANMTNGTTSDVMYFQTRSDTANKFIFTNNKHRKNTVATISEASIAPGTRYEDMPGAGGTATLEGHTWWVQRKLLSTDGVEISVLPSGEESEGVFSADKTYFYKYAFLFDGNQETPLSDFTADSTSNTQFRKVFIKIKSSMVPRRASHITVYRAQSTSSNEAKRDEAYRLFLQIPLTTGPNGVNDDRVGPDFTDAYPGFKSDNTAGQEGWYKYYFNPTEDYATDTGLIGASFASMNGLPEVLKDYRVYYGLSTTLNNMHFVARCWKEELEAPQRMILRSKANRFSVFNWPTDHMELPTVPTALKAFGGRLYAWDEANMYRIDPNNMVIEDITEGVGCLSQDAVVTTDFGMLFADRNDIYLHDGQRANPIGEPILRNTGYDNAQSPPAQFLDDGYQKLVNSAILYPKWGKPRVWCSYIGSIGSFIIGVTSKVSGSFENYIYVYKVIFKRWDKWKVYGTSDEIRSFFIGPDNETYFSFDNVSNISPDSGLHKLLGVSSGSLEGERARKAFTWESKAFTMGSSTQEKKIKNVKILSNANLASTNFNLYFDNDYHSGTTVSAQQSNDVGTENVWLETWKPSVGMKYRSMKIRIYGDAGDKIESIGMVFRRKSIK